MNSIDRPVNLRHLTVTLATADMTLSGSVMHDAELILGKIINSGKLPESLKIETLSVRAELKMRREDLASTRDRVRADADASELRDASDEELLRTIAY